MKYPIIVQFGPWDGQVFSERIRNVLSIIKINLQYNEDRGLHTVINSYTQLGQLIECVLDEYEVMTVQREDNILLYYGIKGRKMTQR